MTRTCYNDLMVIDQQHTLAMGRLQGRVNDTSQDPSESRLEHGR